uniref:RNA-dependent RNA polymerase n=1 Tax=Plasmopara viticola lesion associated narnavirus 27 TaxID=2719511 RepID=A0A6G9RVG5_9VIRU|nr:RNA-dependent RNA polymerase [Plasmopara viticola lesion associated narnavirus 27]
MSVAIDTKDSLANSALVHIWTHLLSFGYRCEKDFSLKPKFGHQSMINQLDKVDKEFFLTHMYESSVRMTRLVRPRSDLESHVDRLYDRVLFTLRALGSTVLLNSTMTESILNFDEELLQAGLQFKRFFFRSCFSHGYLHPKTGFPCWPGIDQTITLIKKLGAWITYYGSFSDITVRPRLIDALPGNKDNGLQPFTWFAGALSGFMTPWSLKPTKLNVHALSTMAGFGRALPPPSKVLAFQAGLVTFTNLTTKVEVEPLWLKAYAIASRRVAFHMVDVPRVTHCSINASACFERTQEDGGTASYVVEQVNALLNTRVDTLCDSVPVIPDTFYDMFGRIALGPYLAWVINRRRGQALMGKPIKVHDVHVPTILGDARPVSFGYVLYRGTFLNPKTNSGKQWNLANLFPGGGYAYNGQINKDYGDQSACFYNETLGSSVALWASSEALLYGHYTDVDGNRLEPVFKGIALFSQPGLKVWVQDRPVPASFMVLEEPGFKVRPLTKNMAFVVILQALLRHPIADSIASDGRCGFGLKSSYIFWDFLKKIKKKKFSSKSYWISTDLSAATDHIPHDLLKVIWENFLPRVGVTKSHPLYALKNFILLDHIVQWRTPRGILEMLHLCGSFMGEPPSFLGLSVYNLGTGDIADFITMKTKGKSLEKWQWTHSLLREYERFGKLPTGELVITGDDASEITDQEGKFETLNYVYRMTNARPSPGKNTVSKVHGIHAENHVFLDGNYNIFLDIIKPKLLTPSTRFHSDNQSSILGKGTQLFLQLKWLEESNFFDSKFLSGLARDIYLDMFSKGFFPYDIKSSATLPIALPPTFGGIMFPMEVSKVYKTFPAHMSYVSWLLESCPISDFVTHAARIQDITSSAKRGLSTDLTGSYWISVLQSELSDGKVPVSQHGFDPTDQGKLYTLFDILNYIKERDLVPLSPTTGMPQVNLATRYCFNEWGFIPIESLIDLMSRQSTFFKCFKDGAVLAQKLSFSAYLKKYKSFWKAVLPLVPSDYKPIVYDDFNKVHWKFQQKLRTFIHVSCLKDGALSAGPSLHVNLGRVNPPQLPMGDSEVLKSSVLIYLRNLSSDDDHEVIFRPEWTSAHGGLMKLLT